MPGWTELPLPSWLFTCLGVHAGMGLHAKYRSASADGCGNASDRDIPACGGTHQERLAVPRDGCAGSPAAPYACMAEQLSTSLPRTSTVSSPAGSSLRWGQLPMSSTCSLGDVGRALARDACGASELLGSVRLPGELKLGTWLEQQGREPLDCCRGCMGSVHGSAVCFESLLNPRACFG